MKSNVKLFKNTVNGEQWLCENIREVKFIDGVEYLTVKKPNSNRAVLIRKDSLTLVKKSV